MEKEGVLLTPQKIRTILDRKKIRQRELSYWLIKAGVRVTEPMLSNKLRGVTTFTAIELNEIAEILDRVPAREI